VKKGMPILEDVVGGFAILVSENDGISPEILSAFTGKHTVSSGSAPQAVITALVSDPLDKLGLTIPDVDKYSVEMQNPEVTKPAGAGDVPLANYKMIGALAVKRGEMERTALQAFTQDHGMTGWAPTQGHIPSGVPYLGFAREDILAGKVKNCMVVGKGSLFLGRMTNLFDGCSFIVQANSGTAEPAGITQEEVRQMIAKAMAEFANSFGAQ
ncbi:MAG: glycine reductase, partial [Clostridiales bacterium]|nr:glycine reductase [Clostridiales bacterium]